MKTVYKSDGEMFDTPAAVDRSTGTLYINPKLWFKLTPFQRKFVKLHEYGHYVLNTDIEEQADAYAFDKLAGTEFRSLKQCIECLETILDPNRLGHKVRIEALYQRALQWDKNHPENFAIDKASGQSTEAENTAAMTQLVIAANEGVNNAVTTMSNAEVQKQNSKFLLYGFLGIAALMLFKD